MGQVRQYLSPSLEQDGDPVKGSQRIVDLLSGPEKGNWPAHLREGGKIPTRIALGDEAFQEVNTWFGRRLRENEEWKERICGTDF